MKNESSEQKQIIENLNIQLKEKDNVIQSLADTNEHPDEMNYENHDEDYNNLLVKMNKMMSKEIAKVQQQITDECKKVKIFCRKKLQEMENKKENEQQIENKKETVTNTQRINPFRTESMNASKKRQLLSLSNQMMNKMHLMTIRNAFF